MSADLPADVRILAEEALRTDPRLAGLGSAMHAYGKTIATVALTAVLPALTAAAAAPFDPMTEPEGFRAYQAGIKAGRADERALTEATAAQAAADEREACALLADYYAEEIACHECGSEAAYSAARLIRSRSGELGGTADGAHTPGGAT